VTGAGALPGPPRQPVLGWTALAMVTATTVWGLFLTPADAVQGEIHRLLYVHVPMAWAGMLALFAVFVASVLYLVQRDPRWDCWALAGVEIGVLCTALTLVLGSLWARPTWGIWWEWDPRLTSTAILLIIYVGYLLVRSLADDPERRARWAAAIGILGFIQVPVVYMSVYWWRSLHQPPSSPRSMASTFGVVLLSNFAAYTVAFFWALRRRRRLAAQELALEAGCVSFDGRIEGIEGIGVTGE